MKKALFAVLVAALLVSTAAAQSIEDIAWTCPEGYEGQTLNVYNWATYIGEDTVANFEELCGVTVTYDVFESNEAVIARLRQGNPGYDITFPNEYAVSIMIRDGLLETINKDNIPNFANVAERWRGYDFDPENEYGMPYLWGTTGVAVDLTSVEEPITSWMQVFELDGRVSWIDDTRTMLSLALLMLGYDPNSMDADEIAQGVDFLLEHGDNVVSIADDDGDALLARGEVDIALEYSGDIYQLMLDCECEDYAYIIPEEGSIVDMTFMVVPVGAPNLALAEVFMDYILDPVVSAQIVNDTFYATPNQAAIDSGLIPEELVNNTALFPSEESLENLYFLADVTDVEQVYNDAWDEILIFIGG
ncbi:MAG: spermidine/putrescine ABC transporter substrate-binding protein [Anaerolineae bacterium]|nr:spermidine/putrescine ABC transporter substrate-binding protein [Anaerolineae bacterium]MCA9888347.1 spermidine/putrescine ABC transporter substrate-binding protein [Anaerolineae bacterium]MCA9893063.1 spermidine/putrescine ABC transporter substrate-binding protein [Anaerolineae bacterium]MCB9459742.1 spermidine/putrescine ABC transporter substrate-binding protein [Anaerolineaceae bacterium]